MNRKAVVLFSGGLDSILATKLMLEQGVDTHALYFSSVFNQGSREDNEKEITKKAKNLGIDITIMDITSDQLGLVKDPKHAMGKNMNPCIDCRILAFKKATELMDKIRASFIVTGEVIGERPLSQRKDALLLIDRKSGLRGLVLRPLSAKLLEETLVEKEGVVDRARLLDIEGRKRDRQLGLAKLFSIDYFPNPSGGCLLTDKGFSNRLRDLLKHNGKCDLKDLELLKTGRQFRLNESAKLIVGRDERENEILLSLARPGDYIFDIINIPSPIGLVRGEIGDKEKAFTSSIIVRYSDVKSGIAEVSYSMWPSQELTYIKAQPITEEHISQCRI